MTPRFHRLLLCLSLWTMVGVITHAEDTRDWLESYYEHPSPERFVSQMKEWSADGTLDNDGAKPALIAFISQLLRQNREELGAWYAALEGLPPKQLQILHTAMLFARINEADEILLKRYGEAFTTQRRETGKILELPLDKEDTLDMLWGYFYATGSQHAIRKIVAGFRFRDAPEKPPGVDVPDGFIPFYKALPQFTFQSLVANAERHPKLLVMLRDMLEEDSTLVEPEKDGLSKVLQEVDRSGPTGSGV